jgi:hypothetical protein
MPKTGPNRTKSRPFVWTPQRELALQLLVEDRLTDEAIAQQVGVCRRTLGYWKTHPEFAAAAERRLQAYARQLRRELLARWSR